MRHLFVLSILVLGLFKPSVSDAKFCPYMADRDPVLFGRWAGLVHRRPHRINWTSVRPRCDGTILGGHSHGQAAARATRARDASV